MGVVKTYLPKIEKYEMIYCNIYLHFLLTYKTNRCIIKDSQEETWLRKSFMLFAKD